MMKNPLALVPLALMGFALLGCATSPPKGVSPVRGFQVDRYLGKWYEIARLDHSFERGLTNAGAEYSIMKPGVVRVVNRGYNPAKGKWTQGRGRAKFTGDPSVASLKVSFFGPFYAGYHVIALDDKDYRWAVVSGPTRGYLWILARDSNMDEALYQSLVQSAKELGYPTDELVRVDQSPRK